MKAVSIIVVLLTLLLTGCSSPGANVTTPIVTTTPPTTATIATTTTQPTNPPVYGNIDITRVAVGSFGVYGSLTINKYQTGVTVDRSIPGYQPLYIINRIAQVSERKIIGTDPGETVADIPIRRILHDSSANNVISIKNEVIDIYDDNGVLTSTGNVLSYAPGVDTTQPLTLDNGVVTTETLKVEKYNSDSTLRISGFTPQAKRTVVITYIPDSQYSVSCVSDNSNEKGYSQAPVEVVNWVSFDQKSVVIPPDAYAPVWITLLVPQGVVVRPKQLWQLTSLGDTKCDEFRSIPSVDRTPEQKLVMLLGSGGLTSQEIAVKLVGIANGQETINKLAGSNYIALSDPNKWEFKIEIQLTSGITAAGVSSEIVYRVGCKVNMAQ